MQTEYIPPDDSGFHCCRPDKAYGSTAVESTGTAKLTGRVGSAFFRPLQPYGLELYALVKSEL